eukprot:8614734-Pyramimonas_sp.AAC.1
MPLGDPRAIAIRGRAASRRSPPRRRRPARRQGNAGQQDHERQAHGRPAGVRALWRGCPILPAHRRRRP